jgi:phage terminase small subunit
MNGTQACIEAGYSEKTADVISTQNLGKLSIQQAIQEAQAKDSEKLNITRATLLQDIKDIMDRAQAVDQHSVCMKGVDQMAKMLGLNEPDKIDIQGQLRVTSSRGAFAER